MKIRSLSLESYGPFNATDDISFAPGINLVVGKNNSGKSFLLKAFRVQFDNQPFRSSAEYAPERLRSSRQNMVIEVSGRELESAGLQKGGDAIIPVPRPFQSDATFFQTFFEQPSITVSVTRNSGAAFVGREYPAARWGGYSRDSVGHRLRFSNARIAFIDQQQNVDSTPDFVWQLWNQKVFYFQPQRTALGTNPYGRQVQLDESASNLAGVLSWMRGEREDLFQKIVSDMREIFEGLKNISITNTEAGFEVRIWPTDEMVIPFLSSSLAASGTGLGQALAILVAAATTDQSIIVIDEINTFLHPGAAKTLLSILYSDYGAHQYIVSTHSSEIIGSGLANSINLVERDGEESKVKGMSRDKMEHLADIGRILGISASDVFIYQRVVWVEGPTEEACFDLIRRNVPDGAPSSVKFVAVSATGDFFSKKRDRDLVLDVYKKLTTTMSPVTPKPLFCFDREGLTEENVQDLRRRSHYQIHFLARRNIESFLLSPAAVASLFRRDYPEISRAADEGYVLTTMQQLASEKRCQAAWRGSHTDIEWLKLVDGASLLADLFDSISESKVSYAKTRDSVSLLSIIIDSRESFADELIATVRDLEEKSAKS